MDRAHHSHPHAHLFIIPCALTPHLFFYLEKFSGFDISWERREGSHRVVGSNTNLGSERGGKRKEKVTSEGERASRTDKTMSDMQVRVMTYDKIPNSNHGFDSLASLPFAPVA